ncbi:MAG: hypothetical protein AAFR93_02645 [Pseudomonadota bacterium]
MDSAQPTDPQTPRPWLGGAGVLLGAGALLVVLISFYAGPFAPQQDLSVSLGALASDTAKSTMRDFFGLGQPKPVEAAWDIDRKLRLGAAVLAWGAILLTPLALIRREPRRWAYTAATFGISAVAFQVFTWLILLVMVLIIVALFREMFLELLASPLVAIGGLLSLFSCAG